MEIFDGSILINKSKSKLLFLTVCYRYSTLILIRPFRIRFARVEVGSREKVFQVKIALRFLLFDQQHRIGLTQDAASGAQFAQFDQFEYDLIVDAVL